jgi:hypothetical protein
MLELFWHGLEADDLSGTWNVSQKVEAPLAAVRETLENQADLRDNDHVIAGAHWGDGQ